MDCFDELFPTYTKTGYWRFGFVLGNSYGKGWYLISLLLHKESCKMRCSFSLSYISTSMTCSVEAQIRVGGSESVVVYFDA